MRIILRACENILNISIFHITTNGFLNRLLTYFNVINFCDILVQVTRRRESKLNPTKMFNPPKIIT